MVGLSQCIFYLFEPQLIFLFRYLFLLNLQEMIGDNHGNETIRLIPKYRTTAERNFQKRKRKEKDHSQTFVETCGRAEVTLLVTHRSFSQP